MYLQLSKGQVAHYLVRPSTQSDIVEKRASQQYLEQQPALNSIVISWSFEKRRGHELQGENPIVGCPPVSSFQTIFRRRRQEVKGTQLEEASKASARLIHARFRERPNLHTGRELDVLRHHNDRLTFHAQKRAAAAQKQLDDDLAEAEEEAEWAARQLEQAQGASGLSCSAVDTGAGDDDD
ncbi:hypothetical protein C8F04DRAFT_1252212 [Mycena alexandri]|uniref:Uncharacterized protein n=1 Tax=Mycena alexandri TaxID=1745969 RepID=A0AAD6XEE8_9AGAR|nr:hypothetical protein C8F04DRAFT_1252212 [Mycena alexandri]